MTFTKPLEYGGHALVWSGDWTPEGARKAISGASLVVLQCSIDG